MLSEAQSFWEAISGKVKQLIHKETQNAFRAERFEVSTAPSGGLIGVRKPYGAGEIFLPYSLEVASASVGDPVLVVWWGSMSNAKVYYMADGFAGSSGGGGGNLPAGGTTSQILSKNSNADNDAGWRDDVHVGPEEPTDPNVHFWLDTDATYSAWSDLPRNYTTNSYVAAVDWARCYARTDGSMIVFGFNLAVSVSPGTTFRTIGSFTLPHDMITSIAITLAPQGNGSTLLLTVSESGTVQIYSTASVTGFCRGYAIGFLA